MGVEGSRLLEHVRAAARVWLFDLIRVAVSPGAITAAGVRRTASARQRELACEIVTQGILGAAGVEPLGEAAGRIAADPVAERAGELLGHRAQMCGCSLTVVRIVIDTELFDLVLAEPTVPGVDVERVERRVVRLGRADVDEENPVAQRAALAAADHVVDLLDQRQFLQTGRRARRVDAQDNGLVRTAARHLEDLPSHVVDDVFDVGPAHHTTLSRQLESSAEVGENGHATREADEVRRTFAAADDHASVGGDLRQMVVRRRYEHFDGTKL